MTYNVFGETLNLAQPTNCHFTKQLIRIITIQWRPGKCGLILSLPRRLKKKFT